jgi:alpha-galactosidase
MHIGNFVESVKDTLVENADQASIATQKIGYSHRLRSGHSIGGQPLRIGSRRFQAGWGDHTQSRHLLHVPSPAIRFEAWVGLQQGCNAEVLFRVEEPAGKLLARTAQSCRLNQEPVHLSVELPGLTDIVIRALDVRYPEDFSGTPPASNVNWCDPVVTLKNGTRLTADDFKTAEMPPAVLFQYDGGARPAGSRQVEIIAATADLTRYRLEETLPDGTLTIRNTVTVYHDFPVIEWLPELVNRSDRPSGIVSDFRSLALSLELQDRSTGQLPSPYPFSCAYPIHDVVLRRTLGSKNCQSDFTEEKVTLYPRYPKDHVRMDTDEGRSSAAWLPYFGLDLTENQGLNIGIGWSGAWYADLTMRDFELGVQAGMPETHFRVLPGETLRQVSIFIHHRDGLSVEDGQNQLRRFLLKHHSPRKPDGSVMRTPLSFPCWGGLPNADLLKKVAWLKENDLPFDIFWVDAGWFGRDREVAPSEFKSSDWASTVGNWRVNQWAHPGGFRPVTDAVHAAGMKFLLWFEMERVMPDTPLAKEHPEWLLKTDANPGSLLLDLGNDDACDWAIEQVSRMVREDGIDYYRQDFNFNTCPYWADRDAADRKGVTEMKHIAGLYRFWDTLHARFPDMFIDNCASGGRRIDFETNSRSICLFRSDMLGRAWYDSSEASHIEIAYLSRWVPLHAGGTTCVSGDDYGFLSGISSGACMSDIPEDFDAVWFKEILETARRMMACFYGDMYLLTEHPESHRGIHAYQCDLPEENRGFFAAFRRLEGNESERLLAMRKIDANAEYELETFRGDTVRMQGSAFQHYLLSLPEPRSMRLVFYRKNSG